MNKFKLFMVSKHIIKDTFKSRASYSDASGYTSFSGEGDIDIDDIVYPYDRSLSPDVRSHGPIDVDTCRKAQHTPKYEKKSMKRLDSSGSNNSRFGKTSSFMKKELSSMCSSRMTTKKKIASTQASNGVAVYEDIGYDSSSSECGSPTTPSTDSIQLI